MLRSGHRLHNAAEVDLLLAQRHLALGRSRTTHQQHEFRVTTPDDWRLRAIAGVFWEDNKLFDQTGWNYKNVPSCTSNGDPGTPGNSGCLSDIGTVPGTTVVNPGVQSDHTSFYQDTVRETKQTAFFASADFDLIPKVLTAHRWARVTSCSRTLRRAASSRSFDCFEAGARPAAAKSAQLQSELRKPAATPSPASRAAAI